MFSRRMNADAATVIGLVLPAGFLLTGFIHSAAAFEMDWHKFLLAIFLGRVARFTILSILVMAFGVAFPATVALSALTYAFIEKPFLGLRGHYLRPLPGRE